MNAFPLNRLFALALLAALCPLAALCAAESNANPARSTVNFIVARKASAASQLVLPASLQALQEASLYARTTGYLAKWLVDIGDTVKTGQTLAVIDSPEVDQQLKASQAALALAQANAALADATAKRWEGLAANNVVSKQEVEEKSAAAKAAQASGQAAEADVARYTQLQSFETIVAPFDGIVVSRGADIGTLITTDSTKPLLFRLAQTNVLRVYASIPQAYMRAVRPGLEVEVLVNEFPTRTFSGKVVRMAGALDPASRTLQTEVQLPNDKSELLPGMFVQLRFKLVPAEPPLLVPSNAVIIRAAGNFVATVEPDNRIKLRPVKFGRDFGTQMEILDGLAEGTRVVANPSDGLVDGMLVEPLSAEKK